MEVFTFLEKGKYIYCKDPNAALQVTVHLISEVAVWGGLEGCHHLISGTSVQQLR